MLPAQCALFLRLGLDYSTHSRFPSPYPTYRGAILHLPIPINPALFANELEHLYTDRGLGAASEFLFDSSESREEGDDDDARIDKLRKDLVSMWRSCFYCDVRFALTGSFSSTNHESATAIFSSHRFMLVSQSPYSHT